MSLYGILNTLNFNSLHYATREVLLWLRKIYELIVGVLQQGKADIILAMKQLEANVLLQQQLDLLAQNQSKHLRFPEALYH